MYDFYFLRNSRNKMSLEIKYVSTFFSRSVSLSLSFSLSLSQSLSVCVCMCVCVCLFLSPSDSLSLSLFYLSRSVSLYMHTHISIVFSFVFILFLSHTLVARCWKWPGLSTHGWCATQSCGKMKDPTYKKGRKRMQTDASMADIQTYTSNTDKHAQKHAQLHTPLLLQFLTIPLGMEVPNACSCPQNQYTTSCKKVGNAAGGWQGTLTNIDGRKHTACPESVLMVKCAHCEEISCAPICAFVNPPPRKRVGHVFVARLLDMENAVDSAINLFACFVVIFYMQCTLAKPCLQMWWWCCECESAWMFTIVSVGGGNFLAQAELVSSMAYPVRHS